MNREELSFVLSQIPPQSEVVIHGGEPTLMGWQFYKEILPQFNNRYSIQTNLTMIDENWISVFKEVFHGRVSSSYDVVGNIRNINTKIWLENIDLLKSNGINPYIVCVFNKDNENNVKEIYNFFKEQKLSFRLNYIIRAGRGESRYSKLKHTDNKYGEALVTLFDMWFLSNSHIIVDPLMEIIEAILMGNSLLKCPFTSKCALHFISINPDGTVLPCGGFESFGITYGNIFKENLSQILGSANRKEAINRAFNLPDECINCSWINLCGGGCRLEALSYGNGLYGKPSVCNELKVIFEHIEKIVDKNYRVVNDWYQETINLFTDGDNMQYV